MGLLAAANGNVGGVLETARTCSSKDYKFSPVIGMEITAQMHHVMGSEYYPNEHMEEFWRRQPERAAAATAACTEPPVRGDAFTDVCDTAITSRKAEVYNETNHPAGAGGAAEDGEGLCSGISADDSSCTGADSDLDADSTRTVTAAEGDGRRANRDSGDGDSSSYASAEAEPEVEADTSAPVECDAAAEVEADGSSYASAEADVDGEAAPGDTRASPLTYTKTAKNKSASSHDALAKERVVHAAKEQAPAADAASGTVTRLAGGAGGASSASGAGGAGVGAGSVAAATYDDVVNGTAADIIIMSGDAKDSNTGNGHHSKGSLDSVTETAGITAVATSETAKRTGVHEGDAVDGGDGGYGSGGDGDGDGVHGAGPRGDAPTAPTAASAPVLSDGDCECGGGSGGAGEEGAREDRPAAAGGGEGILGEGRGDAAAAAAPLAQRSEYAGDKAGGCAGDGVFKAETAKDHDSFNKCAATCTICSTTSSHPLSALAEPWYPRSYTQLYVQANVPVDKM